MKRKLKRNSDSWFDIILGGIYSTFFIIPIFILILIAFNVEIHIFYIVIPVLFTIYNQWKDEYFNLINTELTEKKNFEIVAKTLDNLNWEHFKKEDEIKIRQNKFYLHFVDATIITRSKKIYYNFKYDINYRTGRLTFFFGISTLIKFVFIYKIKKELKKLK
jgi:hypothetical protein